MTIEEKIFARKRFDVVRMKNAGFVQVDGGRRLTFDLMDGDFEAQLFVCDDGEVRGRVIDRMNGEEYAPLRIEHTLSAYVAAVRAAYEEKLEKIAADCCTEVLFVSDQANRVASLIEKEFGVLPDFPFDEPPHEKSGVFRHADTRKWFALVMNVRRGVLTKDRDERRIDVVNLKTDPLQIDRRTSAPGIYPAYHMSHKTWITVTLDETLSDGAVMELIAESFALTDKKPNARTRAGRTE